MPPEEEAEEWPVEKEEEKGRKERGRFTKATERIAGRER